MERAEAQAISDAGRTIWLTGLPGAGKTTTANAIAEALRERGTACCVLDGDQLREGLSSDLGWTRAGRREQARRAAHVACILARSGITAVVALVSPYEDDRSRARAIHASQDVRFFEVWVNTPAEVCSARDPKGHYTAARHRREQSSGQDDASGLTGVESPYESPTNPDLTIAAAGAAPRAIAAQILAAAGIAR